MNGGFADHGSLLALCGSAASRWLRVQRTACSTWDRSISNAGVFLFWWRRSLYLSTGKQKIIKDQYRIRQKSLLEITFEERIGGIAEATQDKENLYPNQKTRHGSSSCSFLLNGHAISCVVLFFYNTNALKRPTVSTPNNWPMAPGRSLAVTWYRICCFSNEFVFYVTDLFHHSYYRQLAFLFPITNQTYPILSLGCSMLFWLTA